MLVYLCLVFPYCPVSLQAVSNPGIETETLLISFSFCVLDSLNCVFLQGLGISHFEMTLSQKVPANVFFLLSISVQTWVLARHFCAGTRTAKNFTMMVQLLISVQFWCCCMSCHNYIFIYPAYNKYKNKVC